MYVYILYSDALDRYYIGQSMYRSKRIRQHRREKKHWTRRADDWREVFCQKVQTRDDARTLEVTIKNRGAARFLNDLGE
jgi:putative endonuclease